MTTALEAAKAVQTAIALDGDGQPLVIDGRIGPKTLDGAQALAEAVAQNPGQTWPNYMSTTSRADAIPASTGSFPWKAMLEPITVGDGPGKPPAPFCDEVLAVIKSLPDEVFALPDGNDDIYAVLEREVPWLIFDVPGFTAARRSVMGVALIIDSGFESGWRWDEGEDMSAPRGRPLTAIETGAWQVSADSMPSDPSLHLCFVRNSQGLSTQDFIDSMKSNHAFAVEYAARLFRVNTRQSGPCNRGWIGKAITREAVLEFQRALGA